MKLSAYRLAKEIHVPAPRVNDIVLEKRGITANTAVRLARFVGHMRELHNGVLRPAGLQRDGGDYRPD